MGPHRFQNVFCLLVANRTKIQPVLKMLRHFAHFVSRYSSVFGLVGEEGEVVSGKGGGGQSSSPRVHPSQCSSLHSVHILLSRVPADVLVGREEREALVMTSPSSVPGIMEEEGEVVSGRREGRSGLSSPSAPSSMFLFSLSCSLTSWVGRGGWPVVSAPLLLFFAKLFGPGVRDLYIGRPLLPEFSGRMTSV